MEAFTQKVRTFDAFPKVDSQHSVRSSRGGLSTLLTIFFGLLIVWIQIGGYLGGYVDHQFEVDDKISTAMLLNIEMLVAMPCKFIHTNALDITHDRYLAAEVLNFQGINSFVIPQGFKVNSDAYSYDTPSLDEVILDSITTEFVFKGMTFNEDAPACHIFGSIPVNKVKGDFIISGKGFGFHDRQTVPFETLNFSHAIFEFSYSELKTFIDGYGTRKKLVVSSETLKDSPEETAYNNFFPLMRNPLERIGKVTAEKLQSYRYYSKIVPHSYEKLGLEIPTMQYSVNEQHLVYKTDHFGRPEGIPGIYFNYDLEPIRLITAERRLSFFEFIVKLGTILGGLLVLASYVFLAYEKLIRMLFGAKFATKNTEKLSGGLLDN